MKKILSFAVSITAVALLWACSNGRMPDDDIVYSITQNGEGISTLNFGYVAGKQVFQLKVNAAWTLASNRDWCTLSNLSGNAMAEAQTMNIAVTVERNGGTEPRNGVITLTAGGKTAEITVTQDCRETIERPQGMELTATELVKQIHMGWNLGNTLEAIFEPGVWGEPETAWGNPKTTRELITAVKEMGFNAVRLPCSWNQFLDADNNIDPAWMARVKEVVDYCVSQQVYALLNIHWDQGWMEEHCGKTYMTNAEIDAVDAKLAKIWTQIATTFKDYDQYLLFACGNEPNAENEAQMAILARYEQTFVDAVRATGGNNRFRNLIVQGPNTNMELSLDIMKMPEDKTPGSLIFEVHFYSPWWFVYPDYNEYSTFFWGKDYIRYGKYDHGWQEDEFLALFRDLKEKFADNDIPMIVGEFGTGPNAPKLDHIDPELLDEADASRCYYHGFMVENFKKNGMAPFLWDTGGFINRHNYTIIDQTCIDAIFEGANKGNYPF